MGIYCFTNRRRAKDAIMLLTDKYDCGMTVFVRESLVYVKVGGEILEEELDVIMHFAERIDMDNDTIPGDLYDTNQFTELYRGEGLIRFRA